MLPPGASVASFPAISKARKIGELRSAGEDDRMVSFQANGGPHSFPYLTSGASIVTRHGC